MPLKSLQVCEHKNYKVIGLFGYYAWKVLDFGEQEA